METFFLGFTIIFSIFGVTLFNSVLSTVTKDILNNKTKPGEAYLANLPSIATTKKIVNGLAVTSNSFVVGGAYGLVVFFNILKKIFKN